MRYAIIGWLLWHVGAPWWVWLVFGVGAVLWLMREGERANKF